MEPFGDLSNPSAPAAEINWDMGRVEHHPRMQASKKVHRDRNLCKPKGNIQVVRDFFSSLAYELLVSLIKDISLKGNMPLFQGHPLMLLKTWLPTQKSYEPLGPHDHWFI